METGMLSMVLQSLFGLALVLALFALLVWAARRLNLHNGGPAHSDFKIIQRMHLDSKNSIVEIRYHDQHYLLGLSPGGMVQLQSHTNNNPEQPTKTKGHIATDDT